MTRKRFIKLLMARGISRNAAVELAKEASGNVSFRMLYSGKRSLLLAGMFQRTSEAFNAISASARDVSEAFWALRKIGSLYGRF